MRNDNMFKDYLYEKCKNLMFHYVIDSFELYFDDYCRIISAHWTEYDSDIPLCSKVFLYEEYDEYKNQIRKYKLDSL